MPNRTEQLDKEIFVCARREPVTRYHLSNIGKESTRSGILMHFEQNGIEITQLRIFTTRYGNLYARINVPSVFADKVESDEFPLPGGVTLSKWLSRPQVQARNRQKPTSTRRRRGQYQDIGNGSEMEYNTRYNKQRKAYRTRDAPVKPERHIRHTITLLIFGTKMSTMFLLGETTTTIRITAINAVVGDVTITQNITFMNKRTIHIFTTDRETNTKKDLT